MPGSWEDRKGPRRRRERRRRRRIGVDGGDELACLARDQLWVPHAADALEQSSSFPGEDVGSGGGVVLPTQADVMVGEGGGTEVETIEEYKPLSDIEYLQVHMHVDL